MSEPLPAYEGDQPYIYVSYSHRDEAVVYDEIRALQDEGARLWYDVGISAGTRWSDELAQHLLGAEKLLFFATPSSVASENCLDEVNFAIDNGKPVVVVHLEPTELPPGASLRLSHRQALYRHELDAAAYRAKLANALGLGAAPTPAPAATSKGRWLLPALGGVLFLTVVGLVIGYQTRSTPAPTFAPTPAVAAASEILDHSIAVLPFDNLSPDPEHAYFAAGIHEEILNQLAKIHDLSVIARTSVLQYAGVHKPISEIARELKVGTIMEGSVRYAGDRVRITAQLIDAESGAHMWSQAYEQKLEDVFGIQLEIATRIAEALKVELTTSEAASIARQLTDVPEAYAHYLNALAKFGNFANVPATLEALDAAIELDPQFATALAFKAWMYSIVAINYQFHDPQAYDRATQERYLQMSVRTAERALALDENLAFALIAVELEILPTRESSLMQERALALNSSDYRILAVVGSDRIARGEVGSGVALMARAVELNPADAASIWYFSTWLTFARRWDEALTQARNVVAIAPDAAYGHANLAIVSALAGDLEAARTAARRAEALGAGPYQLVDVARAYGRIGDQAEAQRIFDLVMSGVAIPNPYWHYGMHVAVGDLETALDHLEAMVEEEFPRFMLWRLMSNGKDPAFDRVRDHPRFNALLASVGE